MAIRSGLRRTCIAAALLVPLIGIVGGTTARAAQGDIDLFAGNYAAGNLGDGGPATSARLNGPTGVAVAADGRVFIADRVNNQIRMVATDGTISTIITGIFNPVDVAVDDDAGLLYFTEDAFMISRLSRVDISGPGPYSAVVIAGVGWNGYAGDGGPASAATFNSIAGIGIGPDGDIYIADRQNNRIRRIDVATGDIDRIAGTGVGGGDNGDALTVATFAGPKDVAVAADGTVYVADEANNMIRTIAGGQVGILAGVYGPAGFSGDDGPAAAAQLWSPDGVAVGPNGDVYIADTSNNRVRKVDAGGTITTVAGNGTCCVTGDGGPATAANIGNPIRVAVDSLGSILIASEPENAIRVVAGTPIVADAGGPYTIAEGDDLVLDGSATGAGPGATYAWDLDGDATFDDAFGASPTIDVADLAALGLDDGPTGPVTVSLRVSESITSHVADSTVTVTNVAPTATINVPGPVVAGTPVTIKVGAIDPGPVDAAADFTYTIDWEGDGVVDETVVGPADPPVTHTYADAGSVSLTVIAIDKDGGASQPTVQQVVVQPAPTTSTTTTTTTTTTGPTTTVPTTVSPILPPTGGSTSTQAWIAGALVMAGLVLVGMRARRRIG